MSSKHISGFTMIELLIVVAIIGIISAISIPAYQAYVLKTQVGRAVGELASYRAAYESRLSESGSVANNSIGYVPSAITRESASDDVAIANGDSSGHLQVTMGGKAHPRLSGVVIRLNRSAEGAWQCVIDPSAAASWNDDFMPPGCVGI